MAVVTTCGPVVTMPPVCSALPLSTCGRACACALGAHCLCPAHGDLVYPCTQQMYSLGRWHGSSMRFEARLAQSPYHEDMLFFLRACYACGTNSDGPYGQCFLTRRRHSCVACDGLHRHVSISGFVVGLADVVGFVLYRLRYVVTRIALKNDHALRDIPTPRIIQSQRNELDAGRYLRSVVVCQDYAPGMHSS